ncbi:hypothetical protein C0431_06970 [bacterium]|nr:hypothetical protein [bacterium]
MFNYSEWWDNAPYLGAGDYLQNAHNYSNDLWAMGKSAVTMIVAGLLVVAVMELINWTRGKNLQ